MGLSWYTRLEQGKPIQVSSAIIFLTVESLVLGATYLGYGIYKRWDLELSLLLLPAYGPATWCGPRMFSHTAEVIYRRLLLALLWVISALLLGRAAVGLFLRRYWPI